MAKRPGLDQQSFLLEWRAPVPKPAAPAEPARAEGVVRKAEAPADAEGSPWWDRVRRVEEERREAPLVAWGDTWRRLLREAGWTDDLKAGERALLEQLVRGLDVHAGVIEAALVPPRGRQHRVQLRLAPRTEPEWARVARHVVDAKADEEVRDLLGRDKVPYALLEAADATSLQLLPRKLASSVTAACTCGGARLPCEHVLGVHFSFAKRLDREPLLLLALRGATATTFGALLDRVREGVSTQTVEAAPEVDPFAAPCVAAPDWSLLEKRGRTSAPLPSPEGWRSRETFDAFVRRLVESRVR